MDLTTIALVSLAVYRGTLLVTGDRITRAPRRRLRKSLRERSHQRMDSTVSITQHRESWTCSCGWYADQHEAADGLWLVHTRQDGSTEVHDRARTEDAATTVLVRLIWDHVHNAPDTSRLGLLLECPWCVSIWLGLVGATVAWAWPTGWWRWPALALAASGVAGVLATLAHPDDED